ncbi:MAG TPA: ParA family protein [Gammaproteobacteria bacterium]|nr:ParA family protein [Gammaproteobacteria bacterium]
MKTLALYTFKGGVGKTAAAVNLSYLAARSGVPTLLWDLDAQGAATWYLGLNSGFDAKPKKLLKGKSRLGQEVRPTRYPALEVLPADLSFRHWDAWLDKGADGRRLIRDLLKPLRGMYGLLVLDCPPTFSRLSENVVQAADLVLSPVIPTPLSLRAWEQIRGHFADKKYGQNKLMPFFSMVDRRRKLHRRWIDSPPEQFRPLMRTWIPYSSHVEQMGLQGAPVETLAPNGAAAVAYRGLWDEVASLLDVMS